MSAHSKEKRTNLLVVRLTDGEMDKVRALKRSNRKINISHIVRDHLLTLVDKCTNVHKSVDMYKYGNPKDWKWEEPEAPVRG